MDAGAEQWALDHFLAIGVLPDTTGSTSSEDKEPTLKIVHANVTLTPLLFPRRHFAFLQSLARPFNVLIDRISRDHEFILESLKDVIEVDEFTASLVDIYRTVLREGPPAQPFTLGIHRSDYMVHVEEGSDPEGACQQVEINTISSGLGALSTLTHQLHKHLLDAYPSEHSPLKSSDRVAVGESIRVLPAAMAAAHRLHPYADRGVVAMIVQPMERNVADQRHIETALLHQHGVPMVRLTLAQVAEECVLDPATKDLVLAKDGRPITVAYYRAGYTPKDYHSQKEWDARLKVEVSRAVKCPSVGYHLAGTKKVQQVLANAGVLERYLGAEDCALVRRCFTGMYDMRCTEAAAQHIADAIAHPQDYVAKPQREGGGHLVAGERLRAMLSNLTDAERKEYVLMRRIKAPVHRTALLRRSQRYVEDCVSEIGVFSAYLGDGTRELENCYAGYLVRTKPAVMDEGGIMVGPAGIDSLCLYD